MDALKLLFVALGAYIAGVLSNLVANRAEEFLNSWKWYVTKGRIVKILVVTLPAILFVTIPVIMQIQENQDRNQAHRLSSLELINVSPAPNTPISFYDLISGIPFMAELDYDINGSYENVIPMLNISILESSRENTDGTISSQLYPIYERQLELPRFARTRTRVETMIQRAPLYQGNLVIDLTLEFEDVTTRNGISGGSSRVFVEYPVIDIPTLELVNLSPPIETPLLFSDLVNGIPFEAVIRANLDYALILERGFQPVLQWSYSGKVDNDPYGDRFVTPVVPIGPDSNTVTISNVIEAWPILGETATINIALGFVNQAASEASEYPDMGYPIKLEIEYPVIRSS